MDRIVYAVMGAIFGTLIGVACWWLYGLALSMRINGPGLDHTLSHWVSVFAGLFAALGFILKEKAGTLVGSTIASILRAESDKEPEVHLSWWQVVLVLAVLTGLVWYLMR